MVFHTELAGGTKTGVSSPCDSCLLRANCFIARLTHIRPGDSDRAPNTRRTIKQGEFLFEAGDRAEAIYLVKVGAVKTLARLPGGGEAVLAHHFPGDIVGATSISRTRHALSAQALSDTRLCELPLSLLAQRWPDGPEFAHGVSELISREVEHGYERIVILSIKQPVARVAHFILAQARRMDRLGLSQSEFSFPISVSELAKYLGLARETVSRQFSVLKECGMIETNGRIMRIRSAEGLRNIAEGRRRKAENG